MNVVVQDKVKLPNGEVLNYRVKKGGDEILLLIHGNMCSSLHWEELMENLPDHITSYAVDLRGFGDSTYHSPIQTIKDLSDDVKMFADSLEISDMTIGGWSLGGAVAMQYVIDNPESAKKLVLINSASLKGFPIPKRNILKLQINEQFLQTKEEVTEAFKIIEKAKIKRNKWFLKTALNQFLYTKNKPSEKQYDNYLEELLKQRNLIDVNYALMQFNISTEFNGVTDGTGKAEDINIPVIVIQGDEDKTVTVKDASDIVEGIGENAVLEILKGCGHCAFFDDMDSVIKLIV